MKKQYIETLRAMAIIAVIVIHSTSIFYTLYNNIAPIDWWLSNLLNSAGRFSVPLFVMISGAVLLGRETSLKTFYTKRLLRLIPPILFWYLFYLLFNYITTGQTYPLWKSALRLVVTGYPYGHLWYITMLCCLMLFAPFINMFVMGKKPTKNDILVFLFIAFIFFILNAASSYLWAFKEARMTWFKTFHWYIVYFVAGYFVDTYGKEYNPNKYILAAAIFALTIIGAILNFIAAHSFGIVRDYFILNNVGPLIFIITLSIFLYSKNNFGKINENKLIIRISEAAFGMYLIHPVFLFFIKHMSNQIDIRPLLLIPITIIATIVASLYSIELIRKSRFLRVIC